VFLVLTSVAIIMFYVAYMCVTVPLLQRRLSGTWPRPDHGPYFSLGRWGLGINVIAVIFQTLIVINLAWPRAAVYGVAWYYKWGAFVFVGGIALIGGIYYLLAQHGQASRVLEEHRAAPTV
jgi:hypothetical protein